MDWRIPEKLKKRVSYARFLIIVQITLWRVCSVLDRTDNKSARTGLALPISVLSVAERNAEACVSTVAGRLS
jgi:hypothetical protein